jgi:hypothetical protein
MSVMGAGVEFGALVSNLASSESILNDLGLGWATKAEPILANRLTTFSLLVFSLSDFASVSLSECFVVDGLVAYSVCAAAYISAVLSKRDILVAFGKVLVAYSVCTAPCAYMLLSLTNYHSSTTLVQVPISTLVEAMRANKENWESLCLLKMAWRHKC